MEFGDLTKLLKLGHDKSERKLLVDWVDLEPRQVDQGGRVRRWREAGWEVDRRGARLGEFRKVCIDLYRRMRTE